MQSADVKFHVFGYTKAGKSTLLNRIMGQKILGTYEGRETANFTTIMLNDDPSQKLIVVKIEGEKDNYNFDSGIDLIKLIEEFKER